MHAATILPGNNMKYFRPTEFREWWELMSIDLMEVLDDFPAGTVFLADVLIRFWTVRGLERLGIPFQWFTSSESNVTQQDGFGQCT